MKTFDLQPAPKHYTQRFIRNFIFLTIIIILFVIAPAGIGGLIRYENKCKELDSVKIEREKYKLKCDSFARENVKHLEYLSRIKSKENQRDKDEKYMRNIIERIDKSHKHFRAEFEK